MYYDIFVLVLRVSIKACYCYYSLLLVYAYFCSKQYWQEVKLCSCLTILNFATPL